MDQRLYTAHQQPLAKLGTQQQRALANRLFCLARRDSRYRSSIKGVLNSDFFFCKIIEVLLLKVESGVSEPLLRECSSQQCDRSSDVSRF